MADPTAKMCFYVNIIVLPYNMYNSSCILIIYRHEFSHIHFYHLVTRKETVNFIKYCHLKRKHKKRFTLCDHDLQQRYCRITDWLYISTLYSTVP